VNFGKPEALGLVELFCIFIFWLIMGTSCLITSQLTTATHSSRRLETFHIQALWVAGG